MASKRYTLDDIARAVCDVRPTQTVRESVIDQLITILELSADESERFYMLATMPFTSERVDNAD